MCQFRGLAVLAGVVALLATRAAQADYYSAEQAYKNKQFDQAFALFREIAEMGHPVGQESLAVMYVNGEGVARDNVLGYGWAVIASEHGEADNLQAIIRQIEPHLTDVARKQVGELQAQFGKAALQESLLPRLPDPGSRLPRKIDPDDCAITWPANPDDYHPRAANRQGVSGSVEVEFTVMPDGRARNPRVVKGVPPGTFNQAAKGVIFNSAFKAKKVNGKAVPCTLRFRVRFAAWGSAVGARTPKMNKSLEDARNSALTGDAVSQLTYALMLQELAVTVDPPEPSLFWYTKAAQAGLPIAQWMVGSWLLNAASPSHDERKALIWLNKAADAGQVDAQAELGSYLLNNSRNPEARARGFDLLESAAKSGHREAQYFLAWSLATDAEESRRDPRRALELLEPVMSEWQADPTAFEIRAAAHALLGDFKSAQIDENRAIRLAARYRWDLAPLKARLARYESGAAWIGDLLAP